MKLFNDSNFLLQFSELFEGLTKVIAVRFSKNTSCYIGLSSYDEILSYLKIVWKLIFNYIILMGKLYKSNM